MLQYVPTILQHADLCLHARDSQRIGLATGGLIVFVGEPRGCSEGMGVGQGLLVEAVEIFQVEIEVMEGSVLGVLLFLLGALIRRDCEEDEKGEEEKED